MPCPLNRIIAIHFLIIATLCSAMEKPPAPHANFRELTTPVNPRQALYLTNNRVVISDSNGCSIIDPTTDTLIQKISSSRKPHIALHPNATKFALAYKKKVTIYNSTTGKNEWTSATPPIKRIASSIFNPLEDEIFISYKNIPMITCHTYFHDEYREFDCVFNRAQTPLIAFHPTKREIALSTHEYRCCLHNTNNKNREKVVQIGGDLDFYEYSPNGSIIAAGDKWDLIVKNLPLCKSNIEQFLQIKFHPNSSILATLSILNRDFIRFPINVIVSYWDTQTAQRISTMPLSFKGPDYRHCHCLLYDYALSFSPNGEQLLITVPGKCVATAVPFEVIYQSDVKEKVARAYWLLNNNQHVILPHDVTQLLIYTLFETLKR